MLQPGVLRYGPLHVYTRIHTYTYIHPIYVYIHTYTVGRRKCFAQSSSSRAQSVRYALHTRSLDRRRRLARSFPPSPVAAAPGKAYYQGRQSRARTATTHPDSSTPAVVKAPVSRPGHADSSGSPATRRVMFPTFIGILGKFLFPFICLLFQIQKEEK